ncbi:MAG: Fur family transcriptional regulator [Thermovirgaceae bacterium]|nr:Fur family transcriptional regulator [Thermovirgaceae bacterium]
MQEGRVNEGTEEYLRRLKSRGFRLTNQRRVIIETLLSNLGIHLNARELLELAQKDDPSIGIATIYRTIDLLNSLGMLNQVNLEEGFLRFEVPDEQMHFHVFCRSCGKTVHLPDEESRMSDVQGWAQDMGFDLLPQTFEMAGLCKECREGGVLEPFEDASPAKCARRSRRKSRCRLMQ